MKEAVLGFALALFVAGCASPDKNSDETSAQPSAQPSGQASDETSGTTPTPMAAADLKWIDLDPAGAPGVKIADLWGNHGTGRFGAFLKLPAGFAVPPHTHTNPMKVVVVSGTYVQGPEGAAEFRLGPGSYLMQPGGSYRHTTACDRASDCVIFVESSGAFDLHVAAGDTAALN